MKNRILTFFCSLCFITFCYGQNKKIDSLLKVLTIAKEDTIKVYTLNAISYEFRNTNPDTAVYFANLAHTLAIKLNDKKGIANALLNSGIGLKNLGNFDEALKKSEAALLIIDQILPADEKTTGRSMILYLKARAYNTIGIIYSFQNNYTEALKNNLSALKIREETGDKEGIASSHNNIGLVYEHLGNYAEALKNYYASLKIDEEIGFKQGTANNYHNIGSIYDDQANYPEALKNYFAGLKIREEIGDKKGVSDTYNNIGATYMNQGNYPEALKCFYSGLKISEEIGNKYGKSINLANIGIIYEKQGNFSEALKSYFASLKSSEEIGDQEGVVASCINISSVYIKQHKYSEASQYFKKALSVSNGIGSLQGIQESYKGLAWVDSARGNFRQSLDYYKKYVTARDSMFSQENAKKIVQSKMQYEFDKKETLAKAEQDKKDILAHHELQHQKLLRNLFIGIIVLLLVLSFLIYRAYRARQLLRLNDIRNKIAGDLHDDIGSTLNSISIYSEVAKKNDEHHDEALEMIGDASRKVIEAMSDIVWTINSENDSFEKIIFRMKSLAYNLFRAKNIEFTFHADEILNTKKLSLENRRNFYLIFKEAVNNLVKYSNATRAEITLTNEDKQIRLRIRDNGAGFDTSMENSGNGLKSMMRRAKEMKAEFVIDSHIGGGTRIELILNS